KYHVVCDTDKATFEGKDKHGLPIFKKGIQKSIYEQCKTDAQKKGYKLGLLQCHKETFEPAHKAEDIPKELRYPNNFNDSDGKPFNANLYWKDILYPNIKSKEINKVPIIKYIDNIIKI